MLLLRAGKHNFHLVWRRSFRTSPQRHGTRAGSRGSTHATACGPDRRLQPACLHDQDEEEVPPESGKEGKEGKEEETKDEAPKDEAPKETQEDSEKSGGEEKSQEKTEETEGKTDAKVRSDQTM